MTFKVPETSEGYLYKDTKRKTSKKEIPSLLFANGTQQKWKQLARGNVPKPRKHDEFPGYHPAKSAGGIANSKSMRVKSMKAKAKSKSFKSSELNSGRDEHTNFEC